MWSLLASFEETDAVARAQNGTRVQRRNLRTKFEALGINVVFIGAADRSHLSST